MAFKSQINRHSFLKATNLVENHHDSDTIIFFVTGNPGMIRYYHEFLALLADNLTPPNTAQLPADSPPASYIIYGTSLAGFGGENVQRFGGSAEERYLRATTEQETKYYNLQEQIAFIEGNLLSLVEQWRANQLDRERKPKVIVIGHSVGGYMAMELLRRQRECKNSTMDIIGEILLFPTVVDIAKSPSGVKFSSLNRIPYLASWASILVRCLVAIIPAFLLRLLVYAVTRGPPQRAVDATMDLLQHRTAIYETIYMAGFEMKEIQSDKWEDGDVWAISPHATDSDQDETSHHRMIFYFGRDDHWVANSTRDKIIRVKEEQKAKLGADPERLKFVVCEDKVAHGFCIRHSDIMARKVANFVKEISQHHP